MKKLLKSVKKWFIYNGRNLGVIVLILSTLACGIYYAVNNSEEIVVEDFGDATISVLAQEISHLSYEDAVKLIANGAHDKDKGLAVMHRLAPISQATTVVNGNADAHLWMALDQLHVEDFGFLNDFPMEIVGGEQLLSPVEFGDSELTKRGQRHLAAAVTLSPELERPALMLAELLIAKAKRNEAIELLIKSASANSGQSLSLGVNVANAIAYDGDDLALNELCWHQVAVQGKSIKSELRGDIGARLSYLLNTMVIGEFELTSAGVKKFERDFDDRDNSESMIAELKATQAYFEALSALESKNLKSAAAYLIVAQKLQVGRPAFVAALQELVEKYPELRSELQAGVDQTDAEAQVEDPVMAAKLALLQANVFPEKSAEYLNDSIQLAPREPTVARAFIEKQLSGENPDLNVLSSLAADALKSKGIKSNEKYKLLMTLGELLVAEERWLEAVMALERALILKSSDIKEAKLHQLLGKSYKALGQELIGDEHLALVE